MMVQPPKRVTEKIIPNREYIYIVDVSGSMHGLPIDVSKTLMKDLLSRLRPTETFNLLLFSGASKLLSKTSLRATDQNIEKAFDALQNEHGGGGTELVRALNHALALPKKETSSRTFVVITDGYVSFEVETFETIRKNLNKANLFAVGIGNGVNRFLIEGMARAGSGEPMIVELPGTHFSTRAADPNNKSKKDKDVALDKKVEKFLADIEFPVLTGLQYEFEDFEAYDVQPIALPDVMANRPVILFGKWRGQAEGSIHLSGFMGDGKKYTHAIEVAEHSASKKNAALRYLWARDRIAMLGDYNALSKSDDRVKQITELGLNYNLLTQYTSFVAIDSQIRNKTGENESVTQPLPLPEGVSNYAVGGTRFAGGGMSRSLSVGSAGMKGKLKSLGLTPTPQETVEKTNANELAETLWLEIANLDLKSAIRTEQEVKNVLKKNLAMLQGCLKHANEGRGKLAITLVLNPNGTVVKAVVKQSDVQNKRVEMCLTAKMRRLQFKNLPNSKQLQIIEIEFAIK